MHKGWWITNRLLRFALFLSPIASFTADKDSLPVQHPLPVSPKSFPIMAWGDTPADPAQLRDMREAGFNISGFCSTSVLSAVSAAGLVCFVDDPRANAYRWTALPADAVIRSNLLSLAKEIASQKAAFGIFLKDEPVMRQLPGLAVC